MHRTLATPVVATALLAAMTATAGAARAHDPTTRPQTQPAHHHGGAGDGVRSVDVFAEGVRVHLLTLHRFSSHGEGAYELRYHRSRDGGASWSQPVVIGAPAPIPTTAHRGADVQLAAAGERIVAAWTARAAPPGQRGERLVTAYSDDGGQSWRAGQPAQQHDAPAELPELTVDARGMFHLVWIELRGRAAVLIHARSTDGGATWSKNLVLDPACCECCWNAVTCGPDGKVYVLYRDVAPRDMSVVRSDDSGATWSAPVTVGRFGWDAGVCPHVGGAVSALSRDGRDSLHTVVWTGQASASGAHAMTSTDNGATWTEPLPLGGAASGAWHADIASNGPVLAAVWDAYTESGTAVFCTISTDAGRTWTAGARLSAAGATATHPRVIRSGDNFRVIWTEQRPGGGNVLVVKPFLLGVSGAP
jgi:hypothetical protein